MSTHKKYQYFCAMLSYTCNCARKRFLCHFQNNCLMLNLEHKYRLIPDIHVVSLAFILLFFFFFFFFFFFRFCIPVYTIASFKCILMFS